MTSARADKVFGMGDSIAAESELEVIRAERAQRRKGGHTAKDIGEDEGIDYDAPESAADMGYALEPFNMRREKQEGDFDADGHYVHNIETLKAVTDKWLDTVDQGEKEAMFQSNQTLADAKEKFNPEAARLENPETLIQELGSMLNPGETPTSALKRFAGQQRAGPAAPKLPHEKRKEKAQQLAKAAAPKARKGPRKKLTEFGDYVVVGAAEDKAASDKAETDAENKSTNVPKDEEAKTVKRPAEDMPPPKRPRKDEAKNKSNDRVTEICDQLLQQGYFDVYQTVSEKLGQMEKATPDLDPEEDEEEDEEDEEKGKKDGEEDSDDDNEKMEQTNRVLLGEGQEAEDVEMEEGEGGGIADMLGDLEPDGEGGDILDMLGDMQANAQDSSLWQYKWATDGEVFGPFKTEQIYAWKSVGMFMGDGVWVRQIDADGNPTDEWQNMKSDPMPAASPAGA
jgi:hypothetical protein